MKIAFINQPWNITQPPVTSGSVAIWTYEVARRLAASHEILVYGRKNHPLKKQETYEGVRFRYILTTGDLNFRGAYRIGLFFQKLKSIYEKEVLKAPFFVSSLYAFEYIIQVAIHLRKEKCDIVHVQNLFTFIPILRAFNPKIKIVLHMHCEWLTQLDSSTIRPYLDQTDMIFGCSHYITQKIQTAFPEYAPKCYPVYNGVDTEHFCNRTEVHDRTIHLMFVGRVSPEKGVHTILKAYEQVVRVHPNISLSIVGPRAATPKEFLVSLAHEHCVSNLNLLYEKDYYDYLERLVDEKCLPNVTFVGSVAHDALPDHYALATILLNPSLSESFGMTLIEAMSCGVPVIGAKTGGMPEIVEDGKSGLLVQPGDPLELAGAISKLIDDKALRIEFGRAGRERVIQRFAWERIVEDLAEKYNF